ncbi:MAG: hypothetical protein ACRECY_00925 [Phyllobacterium sp.]
MNFRLNAGICLIAALIGLLALIPLVAKSDLRHQQHVRAQLFR